MKRTIKLNDQDDKLVIEAYTEKATLTYYGQIYHGRMLASYKGCQIFQIEPNLEDPFQYSIVSKYFIPELYQATTQSWYMSVPAARGAITRAIEKGIITPKPR